MRVITYDVEIAEEVESHPDGWKAAMRGDLGISSIALYDTATKRYHVYAPRVYIVEGVVKPADYEHLFEAADHLNAADVLVGWNSAGFDRRVIEGCLGTQLIPRDYDLLAQVQAKVGFKKGWKLGETSERALGLPKTNIGAHAPTLFKEGDLGRLIDYNINDVHLTRSLANYVFDNGYLIGPDGDEVMVSRLECRA